MFRVHCFSRLAQTPKRLFISHHLQTVRWITLVLFLQHVLGDLWNGLSLHIHFTNHEYLRYKAYIIDKETYITVLTLLYIYCLVICPKLYSKPDDIGSRLRLCKRCFRERTHLRSIRLNKRHVLSHWITHILKILLYKPVFNMSIVYMLYLIVDDYRVKYRRQQLVTVDRWIKAGVNWYTRSFLYKIMQSDNLTVTISLNTVRG